jgi:hypothetical protein
MDYAAPERTTPVGSDEGEWARYWQASITDAGLELTAIVEGSWFVSVAQIQEPSALMAFLQVALKYCGIEHPEAMTQETLEQIGPPLGGYILRVSDQTLVLPGCCADLSNIEGWLEVVEQRPTDWHSLWNGHDSPTGELRVRFAAPSYVVAPDAGRHVEVEQTAFEGAVQRAWAEVHAFRRRMALVAGTMVPKEVVEETARILTEGH